MSEIWVLSRDMHSEGLSEPLVAFTTELEAKAQKHLIETAGYVSVKITKVWLAQFVQAVPIAVTKQESML